MGVQGDHARDQGVPPLRRGSFWGRVAGAFVRQWLLILTALLLLTIPPFVLFQGQPPPGPPPPEEPGVRPLPGNLRVEQAKLETAVRLGDAAAVLDFFRRQTPSEPEVRTIRQLVLQLSSDRFDEREHAADELIALGPRAAALVRDAETRLDPELAARARRCLEDGLKGFDRRPLVSALHFLTKEKPEGTASVLLGYAPFAPDAALTAEIERTLAVLARAGEKAAAALLDALADDNPVRRRMAGLALCQPGAEEHRPRVVALLRDADTETRSRIAMALVALGEKQAWPTLIELLAELPRGRAWAILDLLEQLAGADGPDVPAADVPAARRRVRDAWMSWWEQKGSRLDIRGDALVLPRNCQPPGPTLILQTDARGHFGELIEVEADLRESRRIRGLEMALSVQRLAENRLLIAEYRGRRVTERTPEGDTPASLALPDPVIFAERFPGGTFLVFRDRLVELDALGKEVWTHDRAVRDLATARRLPDGTAILVTVEGECVFVDRRGQQTRRFASGVAQVVGAGIDVLPNRRLLLPDYTGNRVVEYNLRGEVVWQVEVKRPTSAQRQPGGTTLVTSQSENAVLELDRAGGIEWRYHSSGPPHLATRR